MIPDRAVPSPTAVTVTRSDPPAATVPATTRVARPLGDGARLAGDHRLVHVGAASCTVPSAGARAPGRTRTMSPSRSSEIGTSVGLVAIDPLGGVRQQFRQGRERTAGLGDRAHLEPMAEEHDRDQGGQFPPDLDLEQAERARPRVTKATTMAIEMRVIIPGWRSPQFAGRAAQEDQPAVEEHDRAEDRRHVLDRGFIGSM